MHITQVFASASDQNTLANRFRSEQFVIGCRLHQALKQFSGVNLCSDYMLNKG